MMATPKSLDLEALWRRYLAWAAARLEEDRLELLPTPAEFAPLFEPRR